jgi:peptidyl-prolyl cis-trans isomerase SurA
MRSTRVYSIIRRSVIRPALMPAACLVAALAASPSPALAPCVVLKVNGEAITDYDVEQRTKFNLLVNHKRLPRKAIIEELIDDRLKAYVLLHFKIEFTDKDIDEQYAEMARRMHLRPEQVTQALNRGGVSAATVKAKILTDMSWRIVVRGRFHERLQVAQNAEVESQKKGGQAEVTYDYTLRPILFVVSSGNQTLMEERRKDAEALRARFASCEAGLTETRAQHGVVIRPPITKNSADIDPPGLRDLLNKVEVGHLTAPEVTPDGVEMWAVCGKKETKAETPEKRTQREKPFSARFAEASKEYLREYRRTAVIEFMPRCRPGLR